MPKKRCNECKQVLDVKLFWKRKDTDDGFFQKCINCCNTRKKVIRSKTNKGSSYADKILLDIAKYDERKGFE